MRNKQAEKKNNKDPRAAYGAMQDKMSEIIRAFRDITNKHVYFTAKTNNPKSF